MASEYDRPDRVVDPIGQAAAGASKKRPSPEDAREVTARLIAVINTPGDFRERMSALTASLRDWSGCEAVGIRLRDGDDFPYYETCGFPPVFVRMESHLCAFDEGGDVLRDRSGNPVLECMCGNILCGRFDPAKAFFTPFGSFWTNSTTALLASTTEADRQARTRNRCNGEGYESVALVPLRVGQEIVGLLQFNDHRSDRFTPHLIARLESTADTLAVFLSRRQAEERLRASEEKFKYVFDHSNVGKSITLPSGEINVNDALCEMLGYSREEFRATRWQDVTHPDDIELTQREIDALVSGERAATRFTKRYLKKDGSVVWTDLSSSLRRDRDGKPLYLITSISNITDRKQSEEALIASEEKFRLLTENAVAGIYVIQDAKIAYVNPSCALAFGYAPDEMTGRLTLADLIHTDDIRLVMTRMQERLDGLTAARNAVYRGVRKDGSLIDIEVYSMPIEFQGRPAVMGTLLDVTARRRAEEERARLETQLQQAQKMESVGRLAGGVAHDFNNMLGVILGHAEMALERVDPTQPIHADLEEIRAAANRSADLTRQLLAFARKQTVAPRVLDLNDTVAAMLKMLQRLIGEDVQLIWRPGARLWPVKVDPSQIDQILANLCINARDAIDGVGTITIETGNGALDEKDCDDVPGLVPGECVRLIVRDDGCGMSRKTIEHIFEPFFTTKGVGTGTGLGLATVYGAVKQNNGFIRVQSEPGSGATFTIYLPRHAGRHVDARTDGVVGLPMRGRETILVVEDEPAIRRLTKVMLDRRGYIVLTASTPGEALRLAREHPGEIHLLITDVVMPEMNGRTLARNLLSIYPRMQRLFMSGYTADVIAHHGVLDEGVHFIQKPFTAERLATTVRTVLDREDEQMS